MVKVAPAGAEPLANPGQKFGEHFSRGAEAAGSSSWSSLLSSQCGEGEAYCWMGCLSLPPGCTEDQSVCVNMEDLPCCTDTVTDGCLDMDGTCQWQCREQQWFLEK